MLKDKGIYEFVEAAKILHDKKIKSRFLLIGDIDTKNPTSLKQSTLEEWNDKKIIEWLGWVKDVKSILLKTVYPLAEKGLPKSLLEGAAMDCLCLCLPSYREGLPKSLRRCSIGLPLSYH